MNTLTAFTRWLENGGRTIGQIAITRSGEGWELRHADDAGELQTFTRWQDARTLATLDDAGAFAAPVFFGGQVHPGGVLGRPGLQHLPGTHQAGDAAVQTESDVAALTARCALEEIPARRHPHPALGALADLAEE